MQPSFESRDMTDTITFERVAELEAQIFEKQLFTQYLHKLIQLLDIKVQLYPGAVEADCDWTTDVPLEIFRLCTAPLEARLEAANCVLDQSHPP